MLISYGKNLVFNWIIMFYDYCVNNICCINYVYVSLKNSN